MKKWQLLQQATVSMVTPRIWCCSFATQLVDTVTENKIVKKNIINSVKISRVFEYLTHILEKIVPMQKYIILGSFSKILFGECTIQIVEIAKSKIKGTKGLIASGNVRILPVLSL